MLLTRLAVRAWTSATPTEARSLVSLAADLAHHIGASGTTQGLPARIAGQRLLDGLSAQGNGARPLAPHERASLGTALTTKTPQPRRADPMWQDVRGQVEQALHRSDNQVLGQSLAKLPALGAAAQGALADYLRAMGTGSATSLNRQRAAAWLSPGGGLQAPETPFVMTPAFQASVRQAPRQASLAAWPKDPGPGQAALKIDGHLAYTLQLPACARGTYGAVYRGANAQGEAVVLKRQMTSASPAAADTAHTPELQVVGADSVAREAAYLKAAGGASAPLELVRTDDSVFMVMPAFGGDLSAVLGQLSDPAARVDVGRHLLAAGARSLQAAHHAGVVNNDVKPANFLVSAKGELSLADYGRGAIVYSATLGGLPMHSGVGGTEGYMAPERLQPGAVPVTGDLFGLGVSWWTTLLGGAPSPFSSSNILPSRASETPSFSAWYATLPRTEAGSLALPPPSQADGYWDQKFAAVHALDPVAAEYVLEHLLHPDPLQRHTAEDANRHITALSGTATASARAQQRLSQWASEQQPLAPR